MKPERTQVFSQGMVAGLVGYAVVALTFAIANVLMGRSPFHTAALLGGAAFYGLTDPARLVIGPGPVFAYNGFHLVVFLALGVATSWLAYFSERGPHFWYIGAVLMLFVAFHLFGAFLFLTEGVRAAISPWMLILAGFLAMAAMSAYLVWVHPALRREFRDFAAQDSDLAETHN